MAADHVRWPRRRCVRLARLAQAILEVKNNLHQGAGSTAGACRMALTCGPMNREWVRERLEAFQRLCEDYDAQDRRSPETYTDTQRSLNDEMHHQMPTVRKILTLLDPPLADEIKQPM